MRNTFFFLTQGPHLVHGRTVLFVINLFNATNITGFPRPTPSTSTAHKDVSTQTTSPQRLTSVLLLQVHNLDLLNLKTLNFNPLQAIPTQAKVFANHPDLVKDLVDLLPTKTLLALPRQARPQPQSSGQADPTQPPGDKCRPSWGACHSSKRTLPSPARPNPLHGRQPPSRTHP